MNQSAGARSARLAMAAFLPVVILSHSPAALEESARPLGHKNNDSTHCPGLPISLCSGQLHTIYVSSADRLYPYGRRLAVMYRSEGDFTDRLAVFRTNESGLVPEFYLQEPDNAGEKWFELAVFPSFRVPCFVVWSSSEGTHDHATLVCYEGARFTVALEAHAAEFIDLDRDGIPEIISSPEPLLDQTVPPEVRFVYTWTGAKFEMVVKTHAKRLRPLYPPDLVEAIQRARTR